MMPGQVSDFWGFILRESQNLDEKSPHSGIWQRSNQAVNKLVTDNIQAMSSMKGVPKYNKQDPDKCGRNNIFFLSNSIS
jgi:hypothetical protein